MNIALIPNFQKNAALETAQRVVDMLFEAGHNTYVHKEIAGNFKNVKTVDSHGEFCGICHVFVAVGGDGTIIHAAKHAQGKPILGINVGRVGYMAGLEPRELHLLPGILKGDCYYEDRMLLDVFVDDRLVGMALNDVVISGQLSKLLDFDVTALESRFHYRADGLIVATPTGSTAYSLSAGGPVVDPLMDCMIFTPICPHSLFNRSIIFSPKTHLLLRVDSSYLGTVYLTLDGEKPHEITSSESIMITGSSSNVRLIMNKQRNFFDAVNKKLLISDIEEKIQEVL